jgi:hypothetical protein
MAIILHSIIDYEPLKIIKVYEGTYFEYDMSKACLYGTNYNNFFVELRNVTVPKIHVTLLKTITWSKKQEKEARMGVFLF